MRKTVENFNNNPYLTNENFRQHYMNPERNMIKKQTSTQQMYKSSHQYNINQKNIKFSQAQENQVKPTFVPKTNFYKYFQDKIILDHISTNFKDSKLNNIQLRQKVEFKKPQLITEIQPSVYEINQKQQYILQKDKCVDHLEIPKIQDEIFFNDNCLEFQKFKIKQLKQNDYSKDTYEKKIRIFNKYTLKKLKKIDKNQGVLILIVKNSEFQIVNSFNSVKFCYYFLKNQKDLNQQKLQNISDNIVEQAKQRLQITAKHLYLFEKDGSPVQNIFELQGQTLFISATPLFHGIQGLHNRKNIKQVTEILEILEKPLKNQEELLKIKPIEQKIKNEFKEPIEYIYNIIMDNIVNPIDFQKYQKFESKEDYFNSHNSVLKEEQKKQNDLEKLFKSNIFKFKKRNNLEEDENFENENEIELDNDQKKVSELLEQKLVNVRNNFDKENQVYNPWDRLNKNSKQHSYINENINNARSDKAMIKELQRYQVGFFRQNIPQTILKTQLNRKTLHQFYTLFQVLTHLTLNQKESAYDKAKGVNFESYKNGLRENFVYNEDFLQNVFNLIDQNSSGYLGWNEFLNLLLITRNKNLDDKINLFIKIADQQKSGCFTNKQIFDQAKLSLKKIVHEDPQALEEICKFFTSLIFKAIGKQENETIQFQELKNAITNVYIQFQNNQDSNLLAMFCGADV